MENKHPVQKQYEIQKKKNHSYNLTFESLLSCNKAKSDFYIGILLGGKFNQISLTSSRTMKTYV